MPNELAIRVVLARMKADADLVAALLEERPEPPPYDPKRCPRCGETERTENTSTTAERRETCLTCGTSWRPGAQNEET
jgi:hypothetical protein